MDWDDNPKFDYEREPSRDILCIDSKSFYSSVECVARGLNPLKAKLVVMSYDDESDGKRGSGLILASSPAAKKAYGITNVSRVRDLPYPYPDDLVIAPPRMKLYIQKHTQINDIYKSYVDEDNHSIFSVDESFLDVTDSLKLFNCATADEMAKKIQLDVYHLTGIYTTIGIGENPWLAKAALDVYAKHNANMRGEIRYEDISNKLWTIKELTKLCGIGDRTALHLHKLGIQTVYDLAQSDYNQLKSKMGVIGTELYAKAWGIDRSFLGESATPKSKSIGNSQVLNRDYIKRAEIEIVIKEMGDQVATRLRRANLKTECISLWIGFSKGYVDEKHPDKNGFHQQIKVEPTNTSKVIVKVLLEIFDKYFNHQMVRSIGVNFSKLTQTNDLQLNIFEEPKEQIKNYKVDYVVDDIRKKYGFKSIVHAHSLLEGARAIHRSSLVGGHAGGMGGIEGENSDQAD